MAKLIKMGDNGVRFYATLDGRFYAFASTRHVHATVRERHAGMKSRN